MFVFPILLNTSLPYPIFPKSIHVHRQPEDCWRDSGGHRAVGHHNHDYEECPEVPVVMAWLDGTKAWLCVLIYTSVDGEMRSYKTY